MIVLSDVFGVRQEVHDYLMHLRSSVERSWSRGPIVLDPCTRIRFYPQVDIELQSSFTGNWLSLEMSSQSDQFKFLNKGTRMDLLVRLAAGGYQS